MTPPRVIRNRSPSSASRGVSFQYSLQYQLLENTQPFGSFKIQFPPFFPSKIHPPKLQLIETSETKTFVITINPDDSLIESMLVQPFVNTIRFPFDPTLPVSSNTGGSTNPANKAHRNITRRNINTESYLPEYLQVDFRPLLLPNHKEITVTCYPTGYKFFTFSVIIDKPLMDPLSIQKYSPLFIHFKSIDNMPDFPYKQSELEENYAPVFYKCNVNKHEYIFRPQPHSTRLTIDAYVSIYPKLQTDVYFEVHDRDSTLPSLVNAIGTGMITPYTKSQEEQKIKGLHLDIDSLISPRLATKTSLGFSLFHILPPRKAHVSVCPSKEACVVSPGNFFESQTELCIEIIDPIEKYPDFFKELSVQQPSLSPHPSSSIPQKKNDQFHLNLSQMPTPTKSFRSRGLSNSQKKSRESLNLQSVESNTTRYNRWIFTCFIDDKNFYDKLFHTIEEFNSKMANIKNKSILSAQSYNRAIKSSIDLITGFILSTPEEKIVVVESRVDLPNESTNVLYQLTKNVPKNCHFLFDIEIDFPYPRLYNGFDTLIKIIDVNVPISDLLRIDGLYFHKSINSILFTVVQKLNYLLSCKSIKNAEDCDFFPTEKELIQLISKAQILTEIPLQKCIMEILTENSKKRAQKKLDNARQGRLFRSMVDPFISMSSVGAKMLSDMNDPEYVKRLKEQEEKRRIQLKRLQHRSIFDIEYPSDHPSHITSPLESSRPIFVPIGKLKKKNLPSPRERIGRSENGDEEIWLVNDVSEIPDDDGWEIEIINDGEISTYRSPSTYRELEKLNSTSRNTTKTLDPVRKNKNTMKKSISVKRAQTELMKRKPFKT